MRLAMRRCQQRPLGMSDNPADFHDILPDRRTMYLLDKVPVLSQDDLARMDEQEQVLPCAVRIKAGVDDATLVRADRREF